MSTASRLLERAVAVRPEERAALGWSFAYFFAVLCGYYLLRPVREEMGIRGGVGQLPWAFTATFAAMLVAVPLYSALVARLPRARAIPLVYRFFLLHLLLFALALHAGAARPWLGRAFFVWVSVYNLFVVSVFWSYMADLWTSAQARRLFGFIAAGGSLGALAGPALAALLVRPLGVAGLLLVSAGFLEAATRCASRLARQAGRTLPARRPLRAGAAGPRGALHRGAAGGEVQGQELRRHRGLPGRRRRQRLGLDGPGGPGAGPRRRRPGRHPAGAGLAAHGALSPEAPCRARGRPRLTGTAAGSSGWPPPPRPRPPSPAPGPRRAALPRRAP